MGRDNEEKAILDVTGGTEDKILVFSAEEKLEKLSQSLEVFMDVPFAAAPSSVMVL